MDTGPTTNTRTLDVTLRDTLEQLSRAKQTPTVRKLRAEAEHYVTILAGWTSAPPPPRQQDVIIDEIFDLLKRSLSVPLEDADDSTPEIAIDDTPAAAVRADAEAPSRGPTAIARVPVRRQAATAPDPIGSIQAVDARKEPGTSLLRPDRAPWKPVPGHHGVAVKSLRPGRDALVRLQPRAQLAEHRTDQSELLWVLSGTVQAGEVAIHAGEAVSFDGGALSEPIRSLGESTLLLIGSSRRELRAARTEPPPPR